MKVRRARFCHAAQLQGCHFKIMTGVTFAGYSAKVRFILRSEKIPKNSTEHVAEVTLNAPWCIRANC